jgi:predicted nuclease of restriction endonuclease-like (RecB) superfamily
MKKIIAKKNALEEVMPPTKEYASLLLGIKKQVQEAQIKAALSANKELIKLYWSIGKTIVECQEQHGWGTRFVEQLAKDLQNSFPGIGGFSERNIFRMRSFYLSFEKVPQAVAEMFNSPIFNIPWGHNAVLIEKVKDPEQRLWYAQKAIEHGWSRTMLETWIKSDLYHRKGKAITNFTKTLPSPHSDMAQQSLKDPYVFDFLTLHEEHLEHDLEQGLIDNVQKMLLELGKGFAFIGRQYHVTVGDSDFYIDLLFYHTTLRCYVVVELKSRAFAGQLNFYLSVVDDKLRHPDDKPTIGLLLCKTKDNLVAEYALRDINKPIGVAEYETKLLEKLPKELRSSLPTIEEIEAELGKNEILAKQTTSNKKKKTKKA